MVFMLFMVEYSMCASLPEGITHHEAHEAHEGETNFRELGGLPLPPGNPSGR